jgi:hypothetical protein
MVYWSTLGLPGGSDHSTLTLPPSTPTARTPSGASGVTSRVEGGMATLVYLVPLVPAGPDACTVNSYVAPGVRSVKVARSASVLFWVVRAWPVAVSLPLTMNVLKQPLSLEGIHRTWGRGWEGRAWVPKWAHDGPTCAA